MRIVGYIDHPAYKITVFSWSEKYILKVEAGYFEQHYKIPQQAVASWEDLKEMLDDSFSQTIKEQFHIMAAAWQSTIERHQKPTG